MLSIKAELWGETKNEPEWTRRRLNAKLVRREVREGTSTNHRRFSDGYLLADPGG